MSQLGGGCGFRSRGDDIALLQVHGDPVHQTKPDHWMAFKLGRERSEEIIALQRVDRRRGGHEGGIFVIGERKRHGRHDDAKSAAFQEVGMCYEGERFNRGCMMNLSPDELNVGFVNAARDFAPKLLEADLPTAIAAFAMIGDILLASGITEEQLVELARRSAQLAAWPIAQHSAGRA